MLGLQTAGDWFQSNPGFLINLECVQKYCGDRILSSMDHQLILKLRLVFSLWNSINTTTLGTDFF